MLDSGASCNFMSLDLCRQLGLNLKTQVEYNVRLADGGVLKTCGQVVLHVDFGAVKYHGVFHVLPGAIPLILGMSFLGEVSPQVNWKRKLVFKNNKRFTVAKLAKPRAAAHVEGAPTPVHNSFGALADCALDDDNCVEATLDDDDDDDVCIVSDKPRAAGDIDLGCRPPAAERSTCVSCGKFVDAGMTKCERCVNNSFAGTAAQQGIDSANTTADISTSKLTGETEVVPLNQFTRAGKRGHYEYFGLLQLSDLDASAPSDETTAEAAVSQHCSQSPRVPDEFVGAAGVRSLNFTHRTAHGAAGDDDEASVGRFARLAEQQLVQLKQKYPEVFSEPTYPVDRTGCPVNVQHEIVLTDPAAAPPKRKIYPLDNVELEELKKQLSEFLESNRIVPSQSPYGAPILFAKKKGGALRMCIDYRLLNQQTTIDSFPLPRIDELLQRLDGSAVFSKLDLRDGYHQVPMRDGDRAKTAFSCRYGTYEFLVMPFGLSTAPATFQRFMNQVFFELLDAGVVCYLDDLLIYTKTIEQHKALLDRVFSLLSRNKLYLKDSKCHLFLERVNFLGHVVSADGVAVEQTKVQAIKDWPTPKSVNQVQQFLGLANYYRRFVLRFSEIASPLSQLTRKGVSFVWGDEQQRAFDVLKSCLCSTPVLQLFDKSLATRVVCDASNFCIGAVLEQQNATTKKWHPVEYYSKRLSASERNYSATDREFVAIRLALERWRHFLIGIQFLILTDHAALTYLQTSAGVNRRNARWLDFLSQFSFEIAHIKGKENVVADTLSRIPGSELLTSFELCSLFSTLGVQHVQDLPEKLLVPVGTCADVSTTDRQLFDMCSLKLLNGVISIQERESFRQQLLDEQQQCNSDWYVKLVQQASEGNSSLFQFRNDLLCKLVGDHFCPVVPDRNSSTVQVILSDLHASSLGGHLGRRKLLAAAQKRFYWQNMYNSVAKFVRECPVCQQNKGSTQKPAGLLQPLENAERPFQHVSMDFIMSLPISERGYDAIFTVVDRFSRLVRFVPCSSDLTAQQAASLFFEHWVCRFGAPEKIISDRDPRFQSAFWQSLTSALGSRVALSTSYHPQTDGLTERYHRSVEQILRCYCSSQQSSWCTLLSQCEFALNSNVQDSHQAVPFEIVFGRAPTLPIDLHTPLQSQHAHDTLAARSRVHTQVMETQAASSRRMAEQADRRRRPAELAVGQKVWLSTAHLPLRVGARKLAAKWTGPFMVQAQVTREAWRLSLPATMRVHPVFHSSQLKPVEGNPRQAPPIQLADGEGAEEFEVDRILARRVTRGREQFLVRWKGYSEFDDTWEPRANLENAPDALAAFERQQ